MLAKRLADSGEYERLAGELFKNVDELESKNELRKAGEMLWGAILNYGKAILSLLSEEPDKVRSMGHRELRNYIKKLLVQFGTSPRLFSDMEKLHVNFYEDFVDREEYLTCKEAAIKLISLFSKKLWEIRESLRLEVSK